jgi:hypothetical protein
MSFVNNPFDMVLIRVKVAVLTLADAFEHQNRLVRTNLPAALRGCSPPVFSCASQSLNLAESGTSASG